MVAAPHHTSFHWLRNGDEAFAAMLAAIEAARHSVRLETYIFSAGDPGNRFLEALVRAQRRGAKVYVVLDAWGSQDLADGYWEPLRKAGESSAGSTSRRIAGSCSATTASCWCATNRWPSSAGSTTRRNTWVMA